MPTDQTVPDEEWWWSCYADFEDFVGIGRERVLALARKLEDEVSPVVVERLLKANGLQRNDLNSKVDWKIQGF
jgi:hypothetical protein